MADRLYDRRARVTFASPTSTTKTTQTTGDIRVDYTTVTSDVLVVEAGEGGERPAGLRISFKVTKTDGKEPNTAEIVVTNLNDDSRGLIQKKGTKIILEAGYASTGVSRIWRGDARTVDNVRDGADWNSTIKGGDGERAYKLARVSESFAPGTQAGAILQYLANASGLQIGNTPDVVLNLTQSFDQGYVVSGQWAHEMDRFLRGTGYAWSVQDDTLQVLLPGQASTAEFPEISPDSGLIGSPEFGSPEKKGKPALVKFRSLLQPCVPGAKLVLRSRRYNGPVRVKKISIIGDTHGAEWYTDYEGVLLSTT